MDTASERSSAYRLGMGICLAVFVLFAAFALMEPTLAGDLGLSDAAGDLPRTSVPSLIGGIISAVLGLVGVVFLLLMLYGGFLWMTARGNTETVEKAKTTITSAVIGIIIVASAYAVTSFVVESVSGGGGADIPSAGTAPEGFTCSTRACTGSDTGCDTTTQYVCTCTRLEDDVTASSIRNKTRSCP